MCGIVGTYHFDPQHPVDTALLRRMRDEVRHRGPDAEGLLERGSLGLGFRRLAIIDLSEAGNQPMSNEDGSVWIIFNGEYYGFQAHQDRLKKTGHTFRSRSDTETILHLYEDHGIDCLQFIDGMFAFALWDDRRRELFLVRDRLGIKPLVYYADNKRIAFASEIKSLLVDPSIPRAMDDVALHHYLTFMSVPTPWTMYQGIRKLPPGHYLHVKEGRVRTVQYWKPPTEQDAGMQESEMLQALSGHLERSVSSQLVSDVPLGAFLSGGIDSSAVVGMMRRDPARDIRTFSIGFPGLGDYDESGYAKTVANHFHTSHKDFAVTPHLIDILPKLMWHFDEPFAVSSAFALYFLAKMAREHVTVALTGDGGDEVFAGYPFRYSMDKRFDNWSQLPRSLRVLGADMLGSVPAFGPAAVRDMLIKIRTYANFFRGDADEAFFRTFTFFDETEKSRLYAPEFLKGRTMPATIDLLRARYAQVPGADPVNRRLTVDVVTTLVDEMLTKVDRMTMASSLEARVPLLDHRLVEFAARIPGSMKIRGRDGKLPLKSVLKNILPDTIVNRKKHGFNVPMDRWLRGELSEFMHDLLSEETVRRRGFFRPQVVERLMKDHHTRRANNAGQLYILMCFELWYRIFMERSMEPSGAPIS